MKDILIIEDDKTLNTLMARLLKGMGYPVRSALDWETAKDYLSGNEPSLIVLDCRLPDIDGHNVILEVANQYPVIVLTAYGSVQNAVRAMKEGAAEYLTKPVNLDELELIVKRTLETEALRKEHQFYRRQIRALGETRMVGRSKALAQVNGLIDAVAPSDVTVLIEGESGVGKELVANEIHQRSARTDHNFIEIDCCTLHHSLFESELFGHERGAFTGADRKKPGLIEGAEGGTLFLDEIGELDISLQAKLLRVLESGVFRRLGSTKDLRANVRVVAATNRNLEQLSREGKFRRDLYYRLSSFLVQVPPLRERREDIAELVEHFACHLDIPLRVKKTVSTAAMKQLVAYDWPGNVRELRNIIERAIILSGGSHEIRPEHLAFGTSESMAPAGTSLSFDHDPSLEEIEQHYLEKMLEKHSGHRAYVAKVLGISERNLYRLIRKYGLIRA
ncbi:MAG TPA: sigma-54 dependent transcriptional regulator [Candidatus Competibacter sp.]|nr:sigma-54-dependent Fis family transcriptional regulator [Candidatus Competibacteraceae bacterium]HRC72921.1 sigma-54 dependent transcriptional regulator [Candidatus Competibacter sp.]